MKWHPAWHFVDAFDIDCTKYGITRAELAQMQKGKYVDYIRRGNKPIPIPLLEEIEQNINTFCHDKETKVNREMKHIGIKNNEVSKIPAIVFADPSKRIMIVFGPDDLLTGGKYRKNYIATSLETGEVGSLPKHLKQPTQFKILKVTKQPPGALPGPPPPAPKN